VTNGDTFNPEKQGDYNNYQPNPFETCYQLRNTPTYCWTKSYYDGAIYGWGECRPVGFHIGYHGGWDIIDAKYVTPYGTCGLPCQDIYKNE